LINTIEEINFKMSEDKIRLTQFSKGGGCGCKIAPSVLQQIVVPGVALDFPDLLVGNETKDDAAVYRLNETTSVISTTDFFMPIVDDPFDFGRIASANAISDVYAMGGKPMMAIAILGWPVDKIPIEHAKSVLEGARAVCKEAGIPLAGGHTIDSSDPIFGLAVTGTVENSSLKKNNGAEKGDHLIITKPLGSGVLSTAMKRNLLQPEHYQGLISVLTKLNKIGELIGAINGVHALTDVTGFGLLGHLVEIADGSGLSAEISYSAIKKMNGLEEYIKLKTVPDATSRNWNSYSGKIEFEKGVNVMEAFNVLPDPQTNGGLLISVSDDDLQKVQQILLENGYADFIQPIGRMVEKKDKTIMVKV
jgi:selenide, water dikinase